MSISGPKDHLKSGSWNVICDRCGFKFKGEELQTEWNGLKVCKTCHEPRNEQDFLRARPDNRPKPYYRPEPTTDSFLPDAPADPASLIP